MYKSKQKTLKNKLEFHGYYFDGKKLFLMYMDEYGNIVTKEDKDVPAIQSKWSSLELQWYESYV